MRIIVTGGAGFIGSHLVRYLVNQHDHQVLNIDMLTYASDLTSLKDVEHSPNYHFEQLDINRQSTLTDLLRRFQPQAIMNLAAESHVDRSIAYAETFLKSNIDGTFYLLEATREYLNSISMQDSRNFRFVHVSTDEVFGPAMNPGASFDENSPYRPSSPYSASKAAADQLIHAWHVTYGLPTIITRSSNNYGPFQHPEKLIAKTIVNACCGKEIPVYGDGTNVRDWLYVEDHVDALYKIVRQGRPGESLNIGSGLELTNIEIVTRVCKLMDELAADSSHAPHSDLIKFVSDRPGHDIRYSMDSTRIQKLTGWTPKESFDSGIRKTVIWYLQNLEWWESKVQVHDKD